MANTKIKESRIPSTDYKVMLHVDIQSGTVTWPNSEGYYDAISKSEDRKAYGIAENREQDMRREFDHQQNAPKPKKKKTDIIVLEKQYGSMFRKLHKFKDVSVEQLAKQFKIDIADVRTMVKER